MADQTTTQTQTDGKSTVQAQGTPAKQDDTQSAAQGNASAKTFTQDDVTRMMTKEKQEGRNAALKALGFETLEAAKSFVETQNKRLESEKTDLEKAQGTVETLTKNVSELTAKAVAAEIKLNIISEGGNKDNLDDIYTLVSARITGGETDITKAIADVKGKMPSLFGAEGSKQTGTGNNLGHQRTDNSGQNFGAELAKSFLPQGRKESSFFGKN